MRQVSCDSSFFKCIYKCKVYTENSKYAEKKIHNIKKKVLIGQFNI